MRSRKAIIFKNKRTATGVILLLITAMAGKSLPQNQLEAILSPNYHHVHHTLGQSGPNEEHVEDKGLDQTSLPHHHDEKSNTAEHRHCHTHALQIIDMPLLTPGLHAVNQSSIMQDIEKHFSYDGLICSGMSVSVFRPPIA